MRVYSTEDENLEISYELNGNTMGSILYDQTILNFSIDIYDPNSTDVISKVELITDGGLTAFSTTGTSNSLSWDFSVDPEDVAENTYFYVKVTQADGDIAVTAPMWINDKENIGISHVESSASKAIVGSDVDIETVLYNNDEITITDIKIKYYLNGVLISEEDMDDIEPSKQGTSIISVTIDKNGTNTILAEVECKVNGLAREFSDRVEVTGVNSDEVTRVLIDGSKTNAYVTGGYTDNMNYVTEIIQDNGGVVEINLEELSEELLDGVDLLIITDPSSSNPAEVYSDDELDAIKGYVDNGGNLIISSKSDYGDSTGVYGNAAQGNAVLEKIGATTRFNDDQLLDDTENGGQNYRLYFTQYNEESQYAAGIDYDSISDVSTVGKFSFYSGNSILINDHDTTEYIVKGHATTYSGDSDNQGDSTAITEPYALVVEILPNGSKVAVSGVTFFSDFEMDPTSEYSNPTIMTNILTDFAPEKAKTITPIADIRIDEDNDNVPDLAGEIYTIEGIVTAGNTVDGNKFFDVIYVQDDTAGITIHPISDLQLALGQKVQISGTVGVYEGDTQLGDVMETTDVKIVDETINLVEPTVMTTAETMLEENEGLLVQTTGVITKIGERTSGEIYINDDSGEARIYVDGYIVSGSGDTTDVFDRIEVGDTICVIGLAAENNEGDRIRIRNTDEIVVVEDEDLEDEDDDLDDDNSDDDDSDDDDSDDDDSDEDDSDDDDSDEDDSDEDDSDEDDSDEDDSDEDDSDEDDSDDDDSDEDDSNEDDLDDDSDEDDSDEDDSDEDDSDEDDSDEDDSDEDDSDEDDSDEDDSDEDD